MSAFFGRERFRPSNFARKRRRRYLGYGAFLLLISVACIVLLSYLSHKPSVSIQEVTVSGNTLTPLDTVLTSAQRVLSGSYWGLFSKRNIFLVPHTELRSVLINGFPAIESVEFDRSEALSLHLVITEREPSALWCRREEVKDTSVVGGDCYFVDATGFVFAASSDLSGPAYIQFFGGVASSTPIGEHLFTPDRFKEISFFLKSLQSAGLIPVSFSIESVAGGAPDFTLRLTSGVRFLISGTRSLDSTLDNIITVLTDPDISVRREQFLKSIEYIDFRFGNKIYYK